MFQLYLFLVFVFLGSSDALKCYKTNPETGSSDIVDDEKFAFCVSFPRIHRHHKILGHQKIFFADGLIMEELDKGLKSIYENNQNGYSLLSICLLEKYDWQKVWHWPKFPENFSKVEYQFRCVCNTDLCNLPSKFDHYLNNVKKMN